jgi:Uma2 family endonuclease
MATQSHPATVDEFLAWEEGQERKYEFADGVISLFPGVTSAHSVIALRIAAHLITSLPPGRWNVHGPDMAIVTAKTSRYSDVCYTDDERDLADRRARKIQFPKLVVEVLSPSTEAADRGEKFDEYRGIPTLEEYVLVESEKRGAVVFRRRGDEWIVAPSIVTGTLALRSVPVEIDLDAIYRHAGFDDPDVVGPDR